MGGTRAGLLSICLCLACGSSMAGQRKPSPPLADPAKELVRVRIFITTTASTLELNIDGATMSSAIITPGDVDSVPRTIFDHHAVTVSANRPGSALELQVDAIVAGVSGGGQHWLERRRRRGDATRDSE